MVYIFAGKAWSDSAAVGTGDIIVCQVILFKKYSETRDNGSLRGEEQRVVAMCVYTSMRICLSVTSVCYTKMRTRLIRLHHRLKDGCFRRLYCKVIFYDLYSRHESNNSFFNVPFTVNVTEGALQCYFVREHYLSERMSFTLHKINNV